MFKKISKFSLLLVISVLTSLNTVNAKVTIDSAFTWEVIDGSEKVVPTKDMSKTKRKKLDEGNALYTAGINMMKKNNYSGAIEQDDDLILFIYRDEVYDSNSFDKGYAEIIIGKQRNEPIGNIRVKFLCECTRFEDKYCN